MNNYKIISTSGSRTMINLGAKSGQTSKWRLNEGGSRLELGYLADIDNGSRYPRGWWLWWWLRTHDVREVIFSGARYIWREWTAAPAMGPSISVIENIFKFANDNATLFRHNPFPRSIQSTKRARISFSREIFSSGSTRFNLAVELKKYF